MQYGPVPDFPIKGKIVAITGGGSGIGFALTKICHDKGAKVLIGDLKLLPEAEQYISNAPKDSIIFRTCDVSSWPSLHDLITASVTNFGSVPDVYVPCAGVFEPPWSNFWDDNEDEAGAYNMIQINVNHPVKFTRMAMKALAGAEKQGVVCLVASTAGIRGNYLASLYACSKHAVVGFVKSMGLADPEEGVKVVCVLPGMVASPLWTDRQDDIAKLAHYEKRPAMQPVDVAVMMVRMIESREYSGGTALVKTVVMEEVVEKGFDKENTTQDVSPRPDADLSHIKEVLGRERGVKWNPKY